MVHGLALIGSGSRADLSPLDGLPQLAVAQTLNLP